MELTVRCCFHSRNVMLRVAVAVRRSNPDSLGRVCDSKGLASSFLACHMMYNYVLAPSPTPF
jgi:hypothetical protein